MTIIDIAITRRQERIAELARLDDGGDTHAESNRLYTELRGLESVRNGEPEADGA